ncbi:MAG: hypothetical protein AB1631_19240 [Acidobacteriota bacterium]
MKKLIVLLALLLTADGEKKEVTLKGEIVDMHCYISRHNGGQGAAHAGCANSCISRGVTPGFVAEDGKLYVLLNEKMIPVKDKIIGLAGQTVRLTGFLLERDGVRAIELVRVEAAM